MLCVGFEQITTKQGGNRILQNPLIDGAFASNARGGELAGALLGHSLGGFRVRGLYCIAPMPESRSSRGEPHIEAHPSQLIALCYLEDVAPRGGGLHVWPGSHRELYPALGSKLEHVSTPAYETAFARSVGLEPIEVPGRRQLSPGTTRLAFRVEGRLLPDARRT